MASRRKKTRYTKSEASALIAAENDRQYAALARQFGGEKVMGEGTRFPYRITRHKKFPKYRPAKRSAVLFMDLPIGTFYVPDRPSQKSFPTRGLVFQKVDEDQAVPIRKPGTPPPAEWLNISEEEFHAPFWVSHNELVRVRDEPNRAVPNKKHRG